MTFLYGTNMELLYSMPAIGPTINSATANLLFSGTNATTGVQPFVLPQLQNIWSLSQMPGKGIMICASGGYDLATGTGTQNTVKMCLDTALATPLNTLATTGAVLFPNSVVGAWEAQCWMNCVSCTGTISTWYSQGQMTVGPGSAETSTALTYMWGNPIAAGIPQAATLNTGLNYYFDLYTSWASAPTAFVMSQFMIFGLN